MTQTSRSPFSRMGTRSALALLTAAGLAGALSACSSNCCRPAPKCGCSAPASTSGTWIAPTAMPPAPVPTPPASPGGQMACGAGKCG